MKQLLTNSRAKSFRACARLHQLQYNLGYRSCQDADATRFGNLWHDGQEAWFLAIKAGKAQDDWLTDAFAAIQARAKDPLDQVRAEELMLGYHVRWKDEGFLVLEVEVEFLCDLVNPETGAPSRTFDLAGKIDGIVVDRESRVMLLEHKTSSEDIGVGSEYWRRLTLDPQISTYFKGARSLNHQVEGCIYDVVSKPKLQLYQATPAEDRKYTQPKMAKHDGCKGKGCDGCVSGKIVTEPARLYSNQRDCDESLDEFRERLREHIGANPDRYYQRGIVVRLPEQEEDAAYDAWQTARLIREAQLAERHVRNPDACSRYGHTCSFFGVCTKTESIDDPQRFERNENPHQELIQITRKTETAA